MIMNRLPANDEMYSALLKRDASYDGIFFVGVRTTGIFCRPVCPAKKPARQNVEFYASTREALFAGYRPCLRCQPMEAQGSAPNWMKPLLVELEQQHGKRWTDQDLRERGLDPTRVRRWFKQQHGMTFHAYHRAQRVGRALSTLRDGEDVAAAAFENGYESLSAFYDAFRKLLDTTPARGRETHTLRFTRILTPLGPMLAAATDQGLALLEFVDRRMLETQLKRMSHALGAAIMPGANPVLEQTEQELGEYFAGARQEFEVPLLMAGTPFQEEAWRELLTIPYAETRSYGEQARRIQKPAAVRAVARANGDNRMAIIIPCHRVVGSDGKLTGYGGGLWRKKWLLDHELRHAMVLSAG
jgi:AraC family transcriptional regulator, regulatory protein of adaptative response / methylated-DNA-[protein]-cysteine methyltransferase